MRCGRKGASNGLECVILYTLGGKCHGAIEPETFYEPITTGGEHAIVDWEDSRDADGGQGAAAARGEEFLLRVCGWNGLTQGAV